MTDSNDQPLSNNPTLNELFEFIKVDEGVRVLPVTARQGADDTRLFIAIQGNANLANTIMAQIMSHIDDLHGLSQQEEASEIDEPEIKISTV